MDETHQIKERWLIRLDGHIQEATILEFSSGAVWMKIRDENGDNTWQRSRDIEFLEQLPYFYHTSRAE
jgi:hypothetical protein